MKTPGGREPHINFNLPGFVKSVSQKGAKPAIMELVKDLTLIVHEIVKGKVK